MQTRRLRVNPESPAPDAIREAAEMLRAGRLVAFPTETVYGLGANALDEQAVAGIFRAKGRPATDPLIVHLADRAQLTEATVQPSEIAWRLAGQFWPGPLTLVLPRHPRVPLSVTAGRETVAVRVPSHPVALALLRAAAIPVAAPSANRFTRPSPTTAQHVLDDLDGRIDLVLDGGPATIGLESTILDLTQNPPAVLRPGGLPLEALRRVLPEIVLRARFLAPESDEAAPAPGAFLKHYSPRAEVRLFSGPRAETLTAMRTEIERCAHAGRRAGVLAADEDAADFSDLNAEVARLGAEADFTETGRRLFAALRALDQRGVDVILARAPAPEGLGLAIWDRLFRAAEGRLTTPAGRPG